MCTCVQIYIYICHIDIFYMCTCVYICVFTCISIYTHAYANRYTLIPVYIHVYVYILFLHMYVHVYIHVRIYISMYIHTHIHTKKEIGILIVGRRSNNTAVTSHHFIPSARIMKEAMFK